MVNKHLHGDLLAESQEYTLIIVAVCPKVERQEESGRCGSGGWTGASCCHVGKLAGNVILLSLFEEKLKI